jgi:hypothetical protein
VRFTVENLKRVSFLFCWWECQRGNGIPASVFLIVRPSPIYPHQETDDISLFAVPCHNQLRPSAAVVFPNSLFSSNDLININISAMMRRLS